MKRIFVAVDISDEARRRAAAYIESLRNKFPKIRVGWDRAEKLHLTLKFLGETNAGQLTELKKIADEISAASSNFSLQIAETGVFPSPRKARVLWLDVKDEARQLSEINFLLEEKCEKIGFAREKRNYVPHLTIGRVKEPNRARELAEEHLENKFEPVGFEVSEIVVYESQLTRTGSIYTVVSRHEFK